MESASVSETPEVLFNRAYDNIGSNYDVSADSRFLMGRLDADAAPDRLQVVLDWHEELKARMPTGN